MTVPPTPLPYVPARWRRSKPLPRCPDLACRREKRCLGLALGGNCMKTFHVHPDGWAGELADMAWAMIEQHERENPDFVPLEMTDEDAMYEMKKLLEERIAEERSKEAAAHQAPPRRQQARRRRRGSP